MSLKTTSAISEACLEDAPLLADMHGDCFPRAWSASEFQSLLQDDYVQCLILRRSNYRFHERIVGFVLVRSVVDEAEILTIAVHPNCRHSGAGEALMLEIMRKLYADRVVKLFLEVDAANQPALFLYRKLGFRKVGERKGYYTSGKNNPSLALVMQADLVEDNKMASVSDRLS